MTTTETPCDTCKGALWVEDGDPDRGNPRSPGAGLVPCGDCNAGNWESPWPYSGWPGPCREFTCDDAVHPCPLFHDPNACDRPAVDGCGCDLSSAEVTDLLPLPPNEDHPPCPNPNCHDLLHGDPMHTDEHGRSFLGDAPEPADDDRDEQLVDEADGDLDEPDVEWPADVITEKPTDDVPDEQPAAEPPPRPFALTPIYDQLATEHPNLELTP